MGQRTVWACLGFIIFVVVRGAIAYFSPTISIAEPQLILHEADMMASKGTFAFHPQSTMFGLSAMMYPSWLAVLKMIVPHMGLVVDLSSIAMGLNIVLEYLCIVFLAKFFIDMELPFWTALGLALVTICNPLFLAASQTGLETPLFMLWVILTMTYLDRSSFLAAFWAGLALFTRPDGIIVVIVVALLACFHGIRFRVDLKRSVPALLVLIGFVMTYAIVHNAFGVPAHPQQESTSFLTNFVYFWSALASLIPVNLIPWPIRCAIVTIGVLIGTFRWPKMHRALAFAIAVSFIYFWIFVLFGAKLAFWHPVQMVMLLGMIFYFSIYEGMKTKPVILGVIYASILLLDIATVVLMD